MTEIRKSKAKDPNRAKRQPTGDYETGWCKPPAKHQWQPGQSGNPTGRKKGINNFSTDVKKSLTTPVEINRDGKTRKISSQEASLMRLREKALKGDHKSLDRYLDLAQQYNNEAMEKAIEGAIEDADIVNVFTERVRSGAFGMPVEAESPDANDAEGETS